MKIIISPAKSLEFESKAPTSEYSDCIFLPEAERLSKVLKKKSARVLSKLMNISPNLGTLNWQRNQDWSLPFSLNNAKQAIYAFRGEVYLGIDIQSLPKEKLGLMQQNLRILSGQYGLLKPLDLIQAYRLEMGTKLKIYSKPNLYKFWGNKITKALNNEFEEGECLVNLASHEYFRAIQPKEIKAPIITPVFKDFKNGEYKTIMTFAKRARGLMVRYLIENDISEVEDIKGFNANGYAFDANQSTATEFIFTR